MKEFTPTITYIMIDTENKSKQQLIDEVVDRVNNTYSKIIDRYKSMIDCSLYKSVEKDIEDEKRKILKQFINQIEHMDEINVAMEV